MKWIQFLLILFLGPGLPLFQIDQAVDIAWLVCENSVVVKLEIGGSLVDQNLSFNLEPPSCTFNQGKSFFQLKNPISVLLSYFQGTSPFWRPPPSFHPCLDHL
jgi:hypothetical protein